MKKQMKTLSNQELGALHSLKPGLQGARPSSAVTHIMSHGSLQSFAHEASVAEKLSALKKRHPNVMRDADVSGGVESVLTSLHLVATSYFGRFDPETDYSIDSSLMSYLTLPGKGKMYSEGFQPSNTSVAITFMGQFIDHDLTKNLTHLLDDAAMRADNAASPQIDLDSVYGPRTDGPDEFPKMIDGRFVLTKLDDTNNAYDVPRAPADGTAMIPDGRNDENQLLLQVHILLMRVHNLLMTEMKLSHDDAKRETIFNWQSVVLNDHQASVLDKDIHDQVIADFELYLKNPDTAPLRYRLAANGDLMLPHEFAIGFRYGHSQLRNAYMVAPGKAFTLFDNLQPGPDFSDLRGNRPLTTDRVIDWPFFINPDSDLKKSNRLDTLIASAVFDLPESAVPDVPTKLLGNLPQRNLIRSHEIHLTSGERLFDIFFGPEAAGKLTPDMIEPDQSKQGLFRLRQKGGFETPLWYYILKEAELAGGTRLGKLGSRMVGEVVGGGIYYNKVAFVHHPEWTSIINNTRVVMMRDLVDFVTGKNAT